MHERSKKKVFRAVSTGKVAATVLGRARARTLYHKIAAFTDMMRNPRAPDAPEQLGDTPEEHYGDAAARRPGEGALKNTPNL